ncbi:MAG: glycosyltransferase family 4 protein [Acidobacteria bacterium]|nr:glycosyltransferase family 4 protein [Acidobacteriota bacterium]
MTRVLVGTSAYNAHVQHMALSLHEHGRLLEYVTSGLDCFDRGPARLARRALSAAAPGVSRELERRTPLVPCAAVRTRWRWELPRVAVRRLGARRLEDWWWERSERALDRYCAARLVSSDAGAFLGVEHGALATLEAAARARKPGIVAFLSPHRCAREQWVEPEYAHDPLLRTPVDAVLAARNARRDAIRDAEAAAAAWIVAGSAFTARTLVAAGVPAEKLLVVAPGGPEPIDPSALPASPPRTCRFLHVGNAAVHKGTHLLLKAWRQVARPGLELHLYGQTTLPAAVLAKAKAAPGGDAIVAHGAVPAATLPAIYREASVLVFPTLCDGFGLVVAEALANGLPVITTANAGAADLIVEGQNGFVIPAADVEALAEALRWSADHPDELFAMRRFALASAARRTWADFRADFWRTVSPAIDNSSCTVQAARIRASA